VGVGVAVGLIPGSVESFAEVSGVSVEVGIGVWLGSGVAVGVSGNGLQL